MKIDNKTIFTLYEEAKKIKNLGILSPKEIEFGSKKNQNIENHQIVETEFVRGFVMMINNENCKPTKYFDENIENMIGENPLPMGANYILSTNFRTYDDMKRVIVEIKRRVLNVRKNKKDKFVIFFPKFRIE